MALHVQDIDDDRTPVLPDGRLYPNALILDHAVLYAETTEELVSGIIPGYLTSADQAELRDTFIKDLAWKVQEAETGKYEDAGVFHLFDFLDDELAALAEERFVYGETVELEAWDFDLRLVLLASQYQPHTDRMLPDGNLILIDGTTDESLIQSLVVAGVADWQTVSARVTK